MKKCATKNYKSKIIGRALTFDDVTLAPNISEVPAHEVQTRSRLTKNIELSIPLVSAAMDTVTESKMAIKMAELGGIGILHRNMSVKEQTGEVLKVKEVRGAAGKKLMVGAAIGTSGDTFDVTCNHHRVQSGELGEILTGTLNTNLINNGTGPDYLMRYLVHYTVNPSGELTVSLENRTLICK